MAEQSYSPHVSQKEFTPELTQSRFNPPTPSGADIQNTYNQKKAIADAIMSVGQSGAEAFGRANLRQIEQEELNAAAEGKIDKENLIKAEIEGRALAASGKDWNETTAKDLLNKSILYRKGNPELIKIMNRGYLLKSGELTVAQTNSDLKTKAPGLIKELAIEWKKLNNNFNIGRSGWSKEGEFIPDFPEFIAEQVNIEAGKIKGKFLEKNPLINEVLAKEGRRLNFDPVLAEASKWWTGYKEREKALAIDTNLSQNQWGGMTGAEYRTSVQPNLMKKFNLTKQEADLEAIGYLKGLLVSKTDQDGDMLLSDPLFSSIEQIVKYPHEGVTLLDARGEHNTGAQAKELLDLSRKIYKRIYDKSQALATKGDKEREKGIKLQFSQFSAKIRDKLAKASTVVEIDALIADVRNQVDKKLEDNISLYGTLGGEYASHLLKDLTSRRKTLEELGNKPKEPTPDQKKNIDEAIVQISDQTSSESILQEYDIEALDSVIYALDVIRDRIDKEGTDHTAYLPFYEKWHKATKEVSKVKAAKIKEADEKEKADNIETLKGKNKEDQIDNDTKINARQVTHVETIHDQIESYLKAAPGARDDSILENLENLLVEDVEKIHITNNGLGTYKTTESLFHPDKVDEYRLLIAAQRAKTKQEKDTEEGEPVETPPLTYKDISGKIDLLVNKPINELFSANGEPDSDISTIRKELYTKLIKEEISITHFEHFKGFLNGIEKDIHKVLDDTYGSKTVYDEADRELFRQVTGSGEEGISTPLDGNQKKLLGEMRGDLMRFHQSMIKRHGDVFLQTSMENHPLRQGVLNAYVEYLIGRESSKVIVDKYLDVRTVAGEEKRRFTPEEEEVLRNAIPKGNSPHAKAFNALSYKLGGRVVPPTDTTTSDTTTNTSDTTTSLSDTMEVVAKTQDLAKQNNIQISNEEIMKNIKAGKTLTFTESGDFVMEPAWVDKEIIPVNELNNTTDNKVKQSLGFE